MSAKKGLFIGFLFAFLVMGFVSMQRAMPEAKEDRIYKAIRIYSPYKVEKRLGGLTIVDSRDGEKEKPSPAEFYHRLDEVDKEWGNKHLRVENNDVVILGENNQSVVKIYLENEAERKFVQSFYGI
jgi:hypothetical protein